MPKGPQLSIILVGNTRIPPNVDFQLKPTNFHIDIHILDRGKFNFFNIPRETKPTH